MSLGIPIVVINRGWQDFIEYTLRQALNRNPSSPICLIDDTDHEIPSGINRFPLGAFQESLDSFAKIYFHFSVYEVQYELFCFQRWFVLRDFMRAGNLESCFYMDSDVLLFADLTAEAMKYADYDMTLSCGHCAHVTFINNRAVLERFCDYLTSVFSDPNRSEIEAVLADMVLEKLKLKKLLIPLNDMRLFAEFRDCEDVMIGDTSHISGGATFDHNINISRPGYEMKDGHKAFEWVNGQPYCRHLRLDRMIRFNAIHFQAGAKNLMPEYFRLGSPA